MVFFVTNKHYSKYVLYWIFVRVMNLDWLQVASSSNNLGKSLQSIVPQALSFSFLFQVLTTFYIVTHSHIGMYFFFCNFNV
jgi:hypothetical protein